MLRRTTSMGTPREERSRSWIALVILACLSIGACLFYFLHDSKPAAPQKRDEKEKHAAAPYTNRAIHRTKRDVTPGQTPIERPKITGHVYSIDGAPLEGVEVAATTFEVAGNVPSVAMTATSDANGYFSLSLQEGMYHVQGNKPGFGPSYVPARTGEDLSLFLRKSGKLQGRVTDGTNPIQQFSIEVLAIVPDTFASPAPLYSARVEDRDGRFTIDELPFFPVVLRASAEGRAPVFSRMVRVDADDPKPVEVELVLGAGCTLTGSVKDEYGQPVAGVYIDAESKMAAGQMNEVSMDAARQGTSGQDGQFRIEHVPSGPVLVRAYDGSHAVTTALVKVAECDALEPVSLTMTDGAELTGIARASDGTPLPNAKLTLTQRALGFVSTMSDAEGRYRFESVPAGVVRVELTQGERWASVMMKLEAGSVMERDIVLEESGKGEISGKVMAGSRPLSGVKLLVATMRGREKGFDLRYATTDKDGTYRASGLAPGHYMVRVMSAETTAGVELDEEGTMSATIDLDVAAPRPKPPQRPQGTPPTPPPSPSPG